jgi:hypothetical protein
VDLDTEFDAGAKADAVATRREIRTVLEYMIKISFVVVIAKL